MRIVILGAGRMGSWLAAELSARNKVAVFDTDRTKTERLQGVETLGDLSETVRFRPELLINAVSLEDTVPVYKQTAQFLTGECMLCDVASIKQGIAGYYEKCGFAFVSVHPMFGPTFARMDTLREEYGIIITESDERGAAFFREFFTRLGVRIFDCSFQEHDRMMTQSLTIPFVSTLTFAACLDAKAVPGTTFKKHKEIAQGLLSEDDHLLSEILFNPYSLAELDRITARLEFLKHVIKAKDYEEAHAFFDKLRKNIA
jgi:prephenate dehydrogenase